MTLKKYCTQNIDITLPLYIAKRSKFVQYNCNMLKTYIVYSFTSFCITNKFLYYKQKRQAVKSKILLIFRHVILSSDVTLIQFKFGVSRIRGQDIWI